MRYCNVSEEAVSKLIGSWIDSRNTPRKIRLYSNVIEMLGSGLVKELEKLLGEICLPMGNWNESLELQLVV